MDWITTSTILKELGEAADGQAWQRLVRRLRPPVMRFARQMGLPESECEDVAQETLLTFVESYRRGRYDRTKGRLSQWLFGIALRKILRKRRSHIRRGQITPQSPESAFWREVPDTAAATRIWEQEWEQAVVEQCLRAVRAEVEPMTMRAFELVLRDGRTPAEAAEALGISVKAVYNAKYTVLRRMRAIRSDLENLC